MAEGETGGGDTGQQDLNPSRRRFLKISAAAAGGLLAGLGLLGRARGPASPDMIVDSDYILLKGLSADPSPVPDGGAWLRYDLGRLRYSPDGVTLRSIAHTDELGGGASHNLLSATHLDTLAASPVRGDLLLANSTPAWARLAHPGLANRVPKSSALDVAWGQVDFSELLGSVTTAQHGALLGPASAHRHSDLASIGVDDHHAQLHAAAHMPLGEDILQVSATDRLLGRDTAGAGNVEELTPAAILAMLGAFSGITLQQFTAAGANTYTPTPGMKFCIVISTGGGGGGGGADVTGAADAGCGAGGGAGGTCIEAFAAATIGASQTVTIGAGGTAGAATGGTGGTGGNTTFGALHTANGGVGGASAAASARNVQVAAGGTGGVPSGGLANIAGGDGVNGQAGLTLDATDANEIAWAVGGHGGASFWGGGGRGGANAQDGTAADSTAGSEGGRAGVAKGSGGGGGAVLNTATGVVGGAGADGYCLVIEFT